MLESLQPLFNDLTGYEILINVATAFILGLFVAAIYRATIQRGVPSLALTHTLIMLAMITAMVMMAIGDSIARAFSLVGALSIIRFRTVVKDNRDTAFVFFALASGIACGASSYWVAVLGTFSIGFFILLIFSTRLGKNGHRDFLLKMRMEPDEREVPVYRETFDRILDLHNLINIRSLQMGNLLEMTFQVKLKRQANSSSLVSELSGLDGVERVALISSEEEEAP